MPKSQSNISFRKIPKSPLQSLFTSLSKQLLVCANTSHQALFLMHRLFFRYLWFPGKLARLLPAQVVRGEPRITLQKTDLYLHLFLILLLRANSRMDALNFMNFLR